MGFPSCMALPEPLQHVFEVLDHVHLMVRLAFFYLGLFDPTNREPSEDDQSPPIATYVIKKSLPTVEFKRSAGHKCDQEEPVCIICLGCLEGHHKIRELSNCSHVFHSGCLDQWVDQGQMTCPMCRSNLLPERYGRKGCKNSWVVDRISRLFRWGYRKLKCETPPTIIWIDCSLEGENKVGRIISIPCLLIFIPFVVLYGAANSSWAGTTIWTAKYSCTFCTGLLLIPIYL